MNQKLNNQTGWDEIINYWKNQIDNARKHANRNWDLLKMNKKWSQAELKEIEYNIQFEENYIKECEVKLFEARRKKVKKHRIE